MMKKIAALICSIILTADCLGVHLGDLHAASPDTGNDAVWNVVSAEDGRKGNRISGGIQALEIGETAEDKILSADEGRQYQFTLRRSGKLTVYLEGDNKALSGNLTDQKGKSWVPRSSTARGTYTWQLKKGTYYYQVSAAKNTEVPAAGLDYALTVKFKSARAKYEDNTTRKKAAKLPLNKVLYGHLAQNAPSEYFKFTLKKMAPIAISLDTQIDEKTPETFVVSLYNEDGTLLGDWENPVWLSYDDSWYGSWIEEEGGTYQGLTGTLEAGTYYVGVTVKRDESGKVPNSARYGKFAIHAKSWQLPVALKLSYNKAEYTGKKLKLPKITLTEYPNSPYYKDGLPMYKSRYDVKDYDTIFDLETGKVLRKIRKIGKYCFMTGGDWPKTTLSTYGSARYAYAVFTVTPVQGKIKRVNSKKKGQIQMVLQKDTLSTGYEIQIARDKKFKKSRKTIKLSETRETMKGLLSGKKYYIRVRNYKDVEISYCTGASVQESIYGKWSRTKEIVCK